MKQKLLRMVQPARRSNQGAVLAPVFCKAKNDYIGQEAGEKYVENDSNYCFNSY